MPNISPGEVELSVYFRRHLGGRFETAGVRIQFHYNQTPGIHFKTPTSDDYRQAITTGVQDGLALRFPNFPATASIWVVGITVDEVESSRRAFYRVGRMAIDQAFSLAEASP